MHAALRTREPQPLVAGVMWGSPDAQSPLDIRHEARNEDNLQRFGWRRHDLRSYGEQTIVDGSLQIDTAFVKTRRQALPPDAASNEQANRREHESSEEQKQQGVAEWGYGGRWTLRVNASEVGTGALADVSDMATLYVYLGDLHEGATLHVPGQLNLKVCLQALRCARA